MAVSETKLLDALNSKQPSEAEAVSSALARGKKEVLDALTDEVRSGALNEEAASTPAAPEAAAE